MIFGLFVNQCRHLFVISMKQIYPFTAPNVKPRMK